MSIIISDVDHPTERELEVGRPIIGGKPGDEVMLTITNFQPGGMVDSAESVIITQSAFDAIALGFGEKVQEKVEKPEPLAEWELELLEGNSNPLPWIVLKNGKPIAAFGQDWKARDYITHEIRNIEPGENYGLAEENVMTTYVNKYKIEGYDAR